jgi:hypothetical protein
VSAATRILIAFLTVIVPASHDVAQQNGRQSAPKTIAVAGPDDHGFHGDSLGSFSVSSAND